MESTVEAVDTGFIFIMAFAVLLFALIIFLMVFFVVRYRRSRSPVAEETRPHPLMEAGWIAAALALVLLMFFSGLTGFQFLRRPPSGALRVTVTARQWSWLFTYENGHRSSELVVPVGKPVSLALVSQDVIHGFYVPDLRIKQDVVPGMTTRAWFQADAPGEHDILCTQYCGLQHSKMLSRVVAVPAADFDRWYAGDEAVVPGVEALEKNPTGEKLLRHWGCLDCHSTDGSNGVGPSFKGLYGSKVEVTTAGRHRTIVADETYCRRSILEPGADVLKGYRDLMPSGKGKLTDEEIGRIIAAIEELR
jgi:cytochrome c oxidase subunit II